MATQTLSCPGSRGNAVQLTNEFTTSAGVGHPTNTGECPLFLDALDGSGRSMRQLKLDPGEGSRWFSAPEGAASIWVVCSSDCSGRGELTYDSPVA